MKKQDNLGTKHFFDFLEYIDTALDFDIDTVEIEDYEHMAELLTNDDMIFEERVLNNNLTGYKYLKKWIVLCELFSYNYFWPKINS